MLTRPDRELAERVAQELNFVVVLFLHQIIGGWTGLELTLTRLERSGVTTDRNYTALTAHCPASTLLSCQILLADVRCELCGKIFFAPQIFSAVL